MTETVKATPHVLVVGPCDECTGPTEEYPNGFRCDRSWPDGKGGVSRSHEHSCEFKVECPGIGPGRCEGWEECRDPDLPSYDDWDVDEPLAHGVKHERNEGYWSHPTGCCYLHEYVDLAAASEDLVLRPCEGRVAVHHSYEGDGYTVLERA